MSWEWFSLFAFSSSDVSISGVVVQVVIRLGVSASATRPFSLATNGHAQQLMDSRQKESEEEKRHVRDDLQCGKVQSGHCSLRLVFVNGGAVPLPVHVANANPPSKAREWLVYMVDEMRQACGRNGDPSAGPRGSLTAGRRLAATMR